MRERGGRQSPDKLADLFKYHSFLVLNSWAIILGYNQDTAKKLSDVRNICVE
jgi:hypothetical protein